MNKKEVMDMFDSKLKELRNKGIDFHTAISIAYKYIEDELRKLTSQDEILDKIYSGELVYEK